MNKRAVLRFLVILSLFITTQGCNSKEVYQIRNMPIKHINLSMVKNGKYPGEFSYGGYTYRVEVIVRNQKFGDIIVISNRNTSYAKKAEKVIENIMAQQKNDVDAITGATTTSKALLKAVENAINQGL